MNKPIGSGGIPGEAFKTLRTMPARPIFEIMNQIKQGRKMPQEWVVRTPVHIYKRGKLMNAHHADRYARRK